MRITKVLVAFCLILVCAFALVSCADIFHIHQFGEWETVQEATCSTVGERVRRCECTYEEREAIPTTPHTIVVDGMIAPDCTEKGLSEGKHCSVCLTVIVAQVEIEAKGHQWDEGRITKQPQEGVQGEKTFTCTVCTESKTEPVEYVAPGGDTEDNTDEITEASFGSIIDRFLSFTSGVMTARFEKDGVNSFVTYETNGENLHISSGIVGSNPNKNIYTTRVLGVEYRFDFVGGKWVLGYDVARQYRPYAYSPFDSEAWGVIKSSFASFTYLPESGVYYSDSLSFAFSLDGVSYTACDISLKIEGGVLVGCNYTLEGGAEPLVVESTFSDLGNTTVYLPWIHSTHNYTVFDDEHMVYRCAECTRLCYPSYRAEYVGGVHYVGDVVKASDFKVVAYFENGREIPIYDFVIKNGLLDYIETGIALYTEDGDYIGYVKVPAFNSDFLYTGVTDSGLVYLEEDGNLSIIGYIGASGNVVIPEKIEGKSVVELADGAFASTYSYIKRISIPASLVEMNVRAVMSCYSLEWIEVDADNNIFRSIDGNLYTQDGTMLIRYAPANSGESFILPTGVEVIGDYAFEDCHNLSCVTLPEGLIYIGHQAFFSSYITEINIPSSLESIEYMAFDCCTKLEKITVDPENSCYKDIDGDLYSKDGRTLIQYAIGKSATSFVVPSDVRNIENSAFSYAENLATVTISENVCYIASSAFRCSYLDTSYASIKKIIFLDIEGWSCEGESVYVGDPYSNAAYLLDDRYYPLTKEVDEPTFPDTDEPDLPVEPDLPAVVDKHVSYDEFRAEYYAKEFLQYDDSVGRDIYDSIVSDEKLVNSIMAWEGIHLATNPDYEAGQMRRKDLYMILIYDLITGNTQDFDNPLESIYGDEEKLMFEALESIFGDKFISKEELQAFSPEQAANILCENEMFEFLDKVGFVWDLFENGLDAVNAMVRYKAISDMSLGYRNVLHRIYSYTSDQDLSDAALECILYFDEACDDMLDRIRFNEILVESLDDVLYNLTSDIWGCMVKAIFPQVLIGQFAARGAVALCDSIFKLDEFNKAFYELHVAVMFEDAVRDVLRFDYEFDYTDAEEVETYMSAVEIFQRSVIIGMQRSISLLEAKLEDPLVFGSQREQALETIDKINDRMYSLLGTYESFEGNCYTFYEVYLRQEVSSLSPVETAMLYYIGGIYYGEYSYYDRELGAMLLIIERDRLIEDYGYLALIAEYVNASSYDRDGHGIYTPDDIKDIVTRQRGKYIALFVGMSDMDRNSGGDSIYLMSVEYTSMSRFNFDVIECLWQGDREPTSFRNLEFKRGRLTGDVYIGWSKVGEIELSL